MNDSNAGMQRLRRVFKRQEVENVLTRNFCHLGDLFG